ncbi:MAG: 23S rRNA (adenine(2503)-C(2))-methyltransferase RlmN [Anaerolineaceae bacterium]|nr:23S rRNA (adenine(2503)-C(2))-methyltransferase RlmN [Anaerolineaceae bacterium]
MKSIIELNYFDLEEEIFALHEPKFRVKQIWEGIYKHKYLDWNSFSNIPKTLRSYLSQRYQILPIKPIQTLISPDGNTTKILFKLNDIFHIETVLLKNKGRNTICISTQAGCAVGCVFCATGNMGFQRNLSSSEIIGQVLFIENSLLSEEQTKTNIVLMGMGEPFLNYKNVLESIKRFSDPQSFKIGARRITISTIGIPDKIRRFAEEKSQYNLAISLHAPNDKIRIKLVPLSNKYPLNEILSAAKYYNKKTKRRVTYEYVLIDTINSSDDCAIALAKLLRGQNCHVNLIALNENAHFSGKPPDRKTIKRFGNILLKSGIPSTIRNSQGAKIKAGCGQLAVTKNNHLTSGM